MALRLLCPNRRAWLLQNERATRDTLSRSLTLSSSLAEAGALERAALQAACAVEAAEILYCRHGVRESLGGFSDAVRQLRRALAACASTGRSEELTP